MRPSLKQLSIALEVPMQRLSSIAKKPVVGQAYDPKVINWEAIDKFIEARLDKTGYENLEACYADASQIEVAQRQAVSTQMLVGTTPCRKTSVAIGDKVFDKKTQKEYWVDYVNDTIVVYSPVEFDVVPISGAVGNRVFDARFKVVK